MLSGANTYGGGTTVSGGTLTVNGSLLASGNVALGAATLSGDGSVGNLRISSGGTLAPSGTMTATSLTLNSGSVFDYTLGAAAGGNSLLSLSGPLTLSPSVTWNITPGGSWGSAPSYLLATFAAGTLSDGSNGFSGWTIAGSGLGAPNYHFSVSGGSLDLDLRHARRQLEGRRQRRLGYVGRDQLVRRRHAGHRG